MNGYRNLLFFSKRGNQFDFKWNESLQVWEGSVFLPKISNNFVENETIYILEQLVDNSNVPFIGTPHIDLTLPNGNSTVVTEKAKEFFTFSVNNAIVGKPELNVEEELTLTFIKNGADSYYAPLGKIKTTSTNTKALRIDIGFRSQESGEFEDYLVLSDSEKEIARIYLYCESVGEDERYINLLADMGEILTIEEEFIFRNSDIKEDLPNYKLLNDKRKEMIVELHNMKPYLATYKGIFAYLNFFDYYDIRVKELWYDATTKKYSYEEIKLGEISKLDDDKNLQYNNLQKTSSFGLFYDINVLTGEYDESGLPITAKNFAYSQEEVIIKLFGLKEYFLKNNIGGVSKIADIIGEASYFHKFSLRKWKDRSKIVDIDTHIEVKFDATQTTLFIEDLRPLTKDYSACPYDPNDDLSNIQVGLVDTCFVGWMNNYNMASPLFADEPNIPIGAPLRLTNKSFDLPWRLCNFTWNQAGATDLPTNWNNISSYNYYETEWIVEREASNDDTRAFKISNRQKTTENKVFDVFLPYNGTYKVTLVLYGYDGNTVQLTKKRYVEVKVKEADFATFYKIIEPELQSFSKNYLTWNQMKAAWNHKQFDSDPFIVAQNEIKGETFDTQKYLGYNGAVDRNVNIQAPSWRDLSKASWKDLGLHTWESLKYDVDKPARVIIETMMPDGIIQLNTDQYTIPSNFNYQDFGRLANALNALSINDYPHIKEYEWYLRTIGPISFVEGVSAVPGTFGNKYVGASGGVTLRTENTKPLTWRQAKIKWYKDPISWSNHANFGTTSATENAFSSDSARIYLQRHEIPVTHNVFFTFDNSKLPGKTNAVWTILKGDEEIISAEYINFTYKFFETGMYSVKLQIIDSNGNKKEIIKKNYLKVYKVNEFKKLKRINVID